MAKKNYRRFIRITAKVDGFRRAGMAHYGTAEYPVEHFGKELLKSLLAEPMLETKILQAEIEAPAEKANPAANDVPPAEPVGYVYTASETRGTSADA